MTSHPKGDVPRLGPSPYRFASGLLSKRTAPAVLLAVLLMLLLAIVPGT